LLDNCQDC